VQRDGVHRLKNLAENDAKSESTSPTVWHLSEAGGHEEEEEEGKTRHVKVMEYIDFQSTCLSTYQCGMMWHRRWVMAL
jgi:hypothetical protein